METKEVIQARILDEIPSSYDKSEGSIIYDITKPVAIELESTSVNIDDVLNKIFGSTATGSYLDRRTGEIGIYRVPARKSTGTVTVTGNVGATVNIGDYVSSESVKFIFTESAVVGAGGTVDVLVECEVAGTIGNVPANTITKFPVTLEGLTAVNNAGDFDTGVDAETDDELRARYFMQIGTPSTSGNVNHYITWAKEVDNVGAVKVFPLWNGNGTVKVVITDSNRRVASSDLCTLVYNYIEEVRPIGASVTVASATEKAINISATVVLANGYTLQTVQASFNTAITNYFKDIAFEEVYVSYAKVGSLLYQVAGVGDYSNLTINGGVVNVSLAESEIPVLGTITLT